MPKGPQGQRRPADTVAAAIKTAKILTGEIDEDADSPKSAAAALGWMASRKGADPASRVSRNPRRKFQSESLPNRGTACWNR